MFDFLKDKRTTEEKWIDNLPVHPDMKKQVKGAFYRQVENRYPETPEGRTDKANDLRIISQVSQVALTADLPKNTKAFGTGFTTVGGGREIAGYAPAGSILRKVYPNEFTCNAFISEAYWANVKARKELWVETARDGYALVASGNVPQKTIKLINQVLIDLNIPYLRNKIRDNLLVFGNVVFQNQYNKRGGLLKINPLLMELVAPKYDPMSNELEGWYYESGNKKVFIPYDPKEHIFTYNSRSNVLGSPCCNSIIIDIEAALQAAIYNNNVMQKGGLLSVIIGLREPKSAQFINDRVSLSLAEEFTKWLDRKYSGIRSGGGMAFMPMVESVNLLNKISEMDSAYVNLDDRVSRKTALLHGVPPERIGVMTGSQYKNITQVTDSLSLSFDNNNYYVTGLVDDYLTRLVIQEGMGIDNVQLEMSGEFSAISKVGAEFGMLIATNGVDTMTVDEFREDVLHIGPADDPAVGQKYLGEFLRKDPPTAGGFGAKGLNELAQNLGAKNDFFPKHKKYQVNKIKYRAKDIPFIC